MKKTFFIVETYDALIPPGVVSMVVGRPLMGVRPHRLRVEPEIAGSFVIDEVRVDCKLLLANIGSVPATQFSHGTGDDFDLGEIWPGTEVIMSVRNVGRVPLRFRATWAALVLPPRLRTASERMASDPGADKAEAAGSRITGVQETVGSPSPVVREMPNFGWDPERL